LHGRILFAVLPALCTLGICFCQLREAAPDELPPAPLLRLVGEKADDAFGDDLAPAGDVNGDGFADLIVGARFHNDWRGRAYLFLGGGPSDSIADLVLEQKPREPHSAFFGLAVSGAGDVNGDGFDDVIVGAPTYELTGRAYVHFGASQPDAVPDLILAGASLQSGFGSSVSMAGDLNGDGYADIAVGAPGDGLYGVDPGHVYIYYGGVVPDTIADLTLTGGSGTVVFGISVAHIGDVNGDGFTDLAVGAAGAADAFVFLGGRTPGTVPALTLIGHTGAESTGGLVDFAGDPNGDGFADMIVAFPWTGKDAGRVLVYFGGDVLDPEVDLRLTGSAQRDGFGFSALSAGDVNGDGQDDLMVGALHSRADLDSPGQLHIYYGGSALDDVPDISQTGNVDEAFGISAARGGDFNGDGIPELVVGAPCTGGLGLPGFAYIFDVASPLTARSFLRSTRATLALTRAPSEVCIQLEPVNDAFTTDQVDLPTVRLTWAGSGSAAGIDAVQTEQSPQDSDRNGIPEVSACFLREDLQRLFSSVSGRLTVQASLDGRLTNSRHFVSSLPLTVLGTPRSVRLSARVVAGTSNPQGTLEFWIEAAGNVTLRLFDVRGRCIRTLVRGKAYPAGTGRIDLGERSGGEAMLPSGVYFYRLETTGSSAQGRLVVTK